MEIISTMMVEEEEITEREVTVVKIVIMIDTATIIDPEMDLLETVIGRQLVV